MAYWANLNTVNKKSSFTLLESLVAIYILVSGVFGMLTLASNSIALSSIFRDQLRAVNLAQEGIELVRNKRDSNVQLGYLACKGTPAPFYPACAKIDDTGVDPSGWGLSEAEPSGGAGGAPCIPGDSPLGCRVAWDIPADIQTKRLIFVKCNGPSETPPVPDCPQLKFNANDGTYGYWSSGTGIVTTPFTRKIAIEEIARSTGVKELKVISEVRWTNRFNVQKTVSIITYLSPWL